GSGPVRGGEPGAAGRHHLPGRPAAPARAVADPFPQAGGGPPGALRPGPLRHAADARRGSHPEPLKIYNVKLVAVMTFATVRQRRPKTGSEPPFADASLVTAPYDALTARFGPADGAAGAPGGIFRPPMRAPRPARRRRPAIIEEVAWMVPGLVSVDPPGSPGISCGNRCIDGREP